jgi:hypothetical protein
VVALARAPWRLDEEHRLQGKHIGAHEAGHAVHDPRVQQEALVDLQFAMQEVEPHPVAELHLNVLKQLLHLRASTSRTIR